MHNAGGQHPPRLYKKLQIAETFVGANLLQIQMHSANFGVDQIAT